MAWSTNPLCTCLQGYYSTLLKAMVWTFEIRHSSIFGTYIVSKHNNIKLKCNNRMKKKHTWGNTKVYLLINVSVRSQVSNFHTSFSVSGLLYPSFMRGFIQAKVISAKRWRNYDDLPKQLLQAKWHPKVNFIYTWMEFKEEIKYIYIY